MKPKTMILMVIAIVCGLGASYMTSRLLAERSAEPEVEKVTVLAAKKNLDTGVPLKNAKDLFELKQVTKGEEPKDAIDALDKVKDKYLKNNLRKGTYVTAEDLTDQPMRVSLPEGMRMLGIRVNNESIAGGWASLPGSRVDILWTSRKGSDSETSTRVLLENVLVLAADDRAKRGDEQGAMVASVVSVALTPEDCQRVTLSKDNGNLTLILRKPGDVSKAERTKVTLAELTRGTTGGQAEKGSDPKFDDPEGGAVDLKVPQGAAKSAAAPAIEVPQVEKTSEPVLRKHVVWIREGDHTRKVVYLLNDNGEVVQEPVEAERLGEQSSAAPPPPPAAAAAAPQQPAPQAPAAQVPAARQPQGPPNPGR